MEQTLQDVFALADHLPGNYLVLEEEADGARILHHSCDIFALTGTNLKIAPNTKIEYAVVLEDDRKMLQDAYADFLADPAGTQLDRLFRMTHKTKGFIWVHAMVKHYGTVEGHRLCLGNLLDVTKETMISYALMDASDRYICVIEKSSKRILYGNDKFYALIHSSASEAVGKHCYELLCRAMEMKNNDNCLCYSSLNAEPPIETYNPDKKMNLTITGREVVWGEYDAYVFYMTDITEKKQREAELEDSQKRFEVALENSDLMVWEYDIVNSRCIASQKATSSYSIPLVIENYPESLYEMGHTPPETVEQIKQVKQRLLNGETGFSVERRTVDDSGQSQWQKVKYTLECDKNGKPIRAIVCGLDITKQKEMEAKYEEQMEYRNKLAQNAMFSIRLDLDDDCVEDYTASNTQLGEMAETFTRADDFLEHFFASSVFGPSSGLSRKGMRRAALIETYALGQSQIQTVYRCDKLNLYLELNLTMYRNPGNKHLDVFFVLTDVTIATLMQTALQRIARADYDFVAVISPQTGSMRFLAHTRDALLHTDIEDGKPYNYNEFIMGWADGNREHFHTHEDYLAVSEGIRLDNMLEKLENGSTFDFSCKISAENGAVNTFRLSFAYSDETHRQIVFTRSNITQVVQEEQKTQALLEKALAAAKQANQAKTDFLAQMSHDMRTPMNAIIGLSALTLDDAENPVIVRDNMSKMRASSDFLLGLVNDILDTAKLEDGSMTLSPEPYCYSDFISNMRTMFQPQCEAKGLAIRFQKAETNPVILVDKMRLNQIFFNVFSNAVKYTPAGGSIIYTVENYKICGRTLSVDFVIRDTGIGMSEEYQRHLFEPFMQENSRATPELQGSGLGLFITKRLVDLMHGTIDVTSKQDEGTTVRIRFVFDCLVANAELTAPNAVGDDGDALLAGKRVLLAEDHPLNAQIARKLLEKKQMIVTHASNGKAAVDTFRASSVGTFDVILMDIRMPEMSGLDAARAIRALDRPDATEIPIFAMSANAYAEDVQKSLDAGMNRHLAKPVEPKLLYETLKAQFKKTVQKRRDKYECTYAVDC